MAVLGEPAGSDLREPQSRTAALVSEIAEAVAARLTPAALPGPLVSRLCALYSESPEAAKLGAWNTERGRIANYIVPALGARDASTLTLRDLDDLRRSVEHLSPATRNRVLVRLTAILRWSTDRGYLARYPLPRVRLEAEHNERSTARSETDVRAIVAAMVARGRRTVAALVATAYDGGLRRGEAHRLRLSQLFEREGVIALYAAETKGKRDRFTVFSRWSSDLIASVEREPGCPWAFPSGRGKPYNARTVLRYYQEACEDAGVAAAAGETNHFHDVRSGWADKHVELGTPIPDLMRMGGWEDYRTVKRYIRRSGRDIAAQARVRLEASRRRGPQRAPELVEEPGCCASASKSSSG